MLQNQKNNSKVCEERAATELASVFTRGLGAFPQQAFWRLGTQRHCLPVSIPKFLVVLEYRQNTLSQ